MTPRTRRSAVVLVCGLLGALALAANWSSRRPVASDPAPPQLFDAAVACGRPAESAAARAVVLEQAAASKMDRYPFEPADGVEAVRLLAEARACFATGGDRASVGRTSSILSLWKHRIDAEYRAHQLRLQLSLGADRTDDALRELRALRRLLAHQNNAYTDWLENQERRLRAEKERQERTS